LDNLVTLIDGPQLDKFKINLDMIDLDPPELLQFISRTPKLTALDEARMILRNNTSVQVTFSSQTSRSSAFIIELERGWSNLALSSLTHLCASSSPLLSAVENFYIYEDDEFQVGVTGDIRARDWVEVLHPFAAVENLYLSGESVRTVANTLSFLSSYIEAAEVLAVLQKIFLDKTKASPDVMEDVTRFVDARMAAPRSSHEAVLEGFMQFRPTIAVSLWDVDRDDNPFDEGEDDDGDSDEDKE